MFGDLLSTIYSSATQVHLLLSSRKFFSDENGNLLKTGDILKFEKLADTLEEIAAGGADALYRGRIGEDLIRDIQEEGRRGPG